MRLKELGLLGYAEMWISRKVMKNLFLSPFVMPNYKRSDPTDPPDGPIIMSRPVVPVNGRCGLLSASAVVTEGSHRDRTHSQTAPFKDVEPFFFQSIRKIYLTRENFIQEEKDPRISFVFQARKETQLKRLN